MIPSPITSSPLSSYHIPSPLSSQSMAASAGVVGGVCGSGGGGRPSRHRGRRGSQRRPQLMPLLRIRSLDIQWWTLPLSHQGNRFLWRLRRNRGSFRQNCGAAPFFMESPFWRRNIDTAHRCGVLLLLLLLLKSWWSASRTFANPWSPWPAISTYSEWYAAAHLESNNCCWQSSGSINQRTR